jgi:vacuolar-type H+-ATPase subunit H
MGEEPHTEHLTRDIEGTRADLSRNVEALTDKVSPSRVMERRVEATKRRTRSGFSSLRDRIMGSAQSATSSVSSGGSSVKEGVSSASSSVADTASSTVDTARQQTQGNPLAAGLVAFGVGWLVSSVLPVSDRERQAAQRLEDVAKEHGQPVAQQASQVGQEVGQQLKDRAQEAAQEVRSTAQEGASQVADETRSSASTVKEEATGQQ